MQKVETKRVLRHLFHRLAEKAEAIKLVSPALYFCQVNQAIGVLRAAEELGVKLCNDNREEPDHPDTLLPFVEKPRKPVFELGGEIRKEHPPSE